MIFVQIWSHLCKNTRDIKPIKFTSSTSRCFGNHSHYGKGPMYTKLYSVEYVILATGGMRVIQQIRTASMPASSNLFNINSGNGLSFVQRQGITRTSAGILLIGPLLKKIDEILTRILKFSITKTHLKMHDLPVKFHTTVFKLILWLSIQLGLLEYIQTLQDSDIVCWIIHLSYAYRYVFVWHKPWHISWHISPHGFSC